MFEYYIAIYATIVLFMPIKWFEFDIFARTQISITGAEAWVTNDYFDRETRILGKGEYLAEIRRKRRLVKQNIHVTGFGSC